MVDAVRAYKMCVANGKPGILLLGRKQLAQMESLKLIVGHGVTVSVGGDRVMGMVVMKVESADYIHVCPLPEDWDERFVGPAVLDETGVS